jgi:phosphoribosylanthranilate isomerase
MINLTKKIKLCGFTKPDTLQVAIDCSVDFVGLVFASNSPRFVSENIAYDLAKIIPKKVTKVAVVVDLSLSKLQNIYLAYKPDFWQVHGNFNYNDLLLLKKNFSETKIIPAFNIKSADDLAKINDFSNINSEKNKIYPRKKYTAVQKKLATLRKKIATIQRLSKRPPKN